MREALFDYAPCACFAFTDDLRLVAVNQTLAQLVESDIEGLMHKNAETLFTLPTRIFFQTHFFPLIRMQGHAEEIFLTLRTPSGQPVPVLLNAKRMEWEEQLITCCACITVPNRKKFEDELVAARKTAEQALADNSELRQAKEALLEQARYLDEQIELVRGQNQELKQFSHAVTHNLKEPLRKILLYMGRVETEQTEAAMSKLAKAAGQLKKVVSALQHYVWLNDQPVRYSSLLLSDLVKQAAAQVESELAPGLLKVTINGMNELEGDASQLQLLFYQLFSNAVKFRRGDTAVVTIDSTLLKQNSFRNLEDRYRYEEYLRIRVRDEGIGFAPEYKEQIFGLFKKLHHSEGQGVGLAICRKIAENHQGHMDARSEPGCYSVLTLYLPVRHERSSSHPHSEQ
ncbi:MAG TPA: ATP-binding protein [Flavisolibacter sp.]|jgi:sigma-B regulation protein RsbU (phosphoserine phosphatase)|nr:ATP-binding protein [Flavisolibacter sp.]